MKPLKWVGSALEDLKNFPFEVQRDMGYALHFAQIGQKHGSAKPLKGIGSGVMEIVNNHDSDTYRAVYTVKIGDAIYVLHAFQKKSLKGIKTSLQDINLIKERLKRLGRMTHEK